MSDLGFVDHYEDLFTRISRTCNADDIHTLYTDVRRFMDMYCARLRKSFLA